MVGPRGGLLSVLCFLSASWLGPAGAEAQPQRPRPVELEARPVFGAELALGNAHVPVVVTARNVTGRPMRGEVRVKVQHWSESPFHHVVSLDLPARQGRKIRLAPFVPEGASLLVEYSVEGRVLSSTSLGVTYSPLPWGLVVMSDPARLRGALLDLSIDVPATTGYGSPTLAAPGVGAVSFDAASGDPVLPRHAVGWSSVGLLIANAHQLARSGAAEKAALTDWLRSGGRLLMFPRTPGELADPFLRTLTGDVERVGIGRSHSHDALVPDGARGYVYRGGPGFSSEHFGGSRRIGFGQVLVASYDGSASPYVDAPETRALVRAILESSHRNGNLQAALTLGRGTDNIGSEWWHQGPSFGALRAALDPNEISRPALGLVALVLILYVVVVGPVNFSFVGRRNQPTLALITTPLLAAACAVLLLGVGYVGKGTRMRYRAVEVVEAVEGDPFGPARRYSGLFSTRPVSYDLSAEEQGIVRLVRLPSSGSSTYLDWSSEQPRVTNARGTLWETVFVREERIVELGGGIHFERADRRLTAVHNRTSIPIRGAVVIDTSGGVYQVGSVPANGHVPIPSTSAMSISVPNAFHGPDDPALRQLASLMGLADERFKALGGVTRVLGGNLASTAPILLAWHEVEPRGEVAGEFARELDISFLRVEPDLRPALLPEDLMPTGGRSPGDVLGGVGHDSAEGAVEEVHP